MKSVHSILTLFLISPNYILCQINGIVIYCHRFRLSSSFCSDCFEWGVEYHGGGLEDPMVTGVTSPDSCQLLCQEWRLQHTNHQSRPDHQNPYHKASPWLLNDDVNTPGCQDRVGCNYFAWVSSQHDVAG